MVRRMRPKGQFQEQDWHIILDNLWRLKPGIGLVKRDTSATRPTPKKKYERLLVQRLRVEGELATILVDSAT